MLKNWKNLSVVEKITVIIQFAICLAIIVLGVVQVASDEVPGYILPILCSASMFTSAIGNWKKVRSLSYVNLGMGAVILICAVIIAFAK